MPAQIPGSTLVKLKATGHCPNLSAPAETVTAIADFLKEQPGPGAEGGPRVPGKSQAAFYSALADDDPAELYENAPCGYLSTRPDGTIIKANATFLAWTGYDRETW